MLILLTNDDGIRAPGIIAIYRELIKLGEVHVVAPETVQSAAGHGITIYTPILTSKVTIEGAFTGTAVDGRPADCVKLATSHLLPRTPDLVVSGMNSGVNVGINVIYSGTVAAAIEAAFLGLPSVAVSLMLDPPQSPDYAHGAKLARETIEQVLAAGIKSGQVASINIPPLRNGQNPTGVKIARQCTRPWVDTYERRVNPHGRDYFWNSSIFKLNDSDQDTDVAYVQQGYITITPLQFDMTHHPMLRDWEGRDWTRRK
ncbi:MAG TPA: 5'/3'-nucleotidase SurE [Tepidisphaeraceae bacterium]|nr:5'/3'-nucleotidase SurE [Tepidisphaeraceae bacterium]